MRVILILLLMGVMAYAYSQFKRMDSQKQSKWWRNLIVAMVVVLMGFLAMTGRLNWLLAGLGILLPLVPRVARLLLGAWPSLLPFLRRYQQNKQSNMQTDILQLKIDMLSGELQGEVLLGEFKGLKLKMMTEQQLKKLLEYCQQHDQKSTALLVSYLDRVHPNWSAASSHSSEYTDDIDGSGKMSEQQAREILGVKADASKKEIIKAHKQLMQKVHPDRGGSDYLAMQINKAKARLV